MLVTLTERGKHVKSEGETLSYRTAETCTSCSGGVEGTNNRASRMQYIGNISQNNNNHIIHNVA